MCRRSRIATAGCTLSLIKFIEELWNAAATSELELEFQESVMADCLNAMMNLTTNVENQVRARMLCLRSYACVHRLFPIAVLNW